MTHRTQANLMKVSFLSAICGVFLLQFVSAGTPARKITDAGSDTLQSTDINKNVRQTLRK